MRWLLALLIVTEIIFLMVRYPSPEAGRFIMVTAHIGQSAADPHHQDEDSACSQEDLCEWFLHSFAEKVDVTASVIVKSTPEITSEQVGDRRRVQIALPSGYGYCTSMLHVTSFAEPGAETPTSLTAASKPGGVSLDLVAPRLGMGPAGGWLAADIAIIGISAGSATYGGACDPVGRPIVDCRASSGGGQSSTCSTPAGPGK
jgi:hypothetical protein